MEGWPVIHGSFADDFLARLLEGLPSHFSGEVFTRRLDLLSSNNGSSACFFKFMQDPSISALKHWTKLDGLEFLVPAIIVLLLRRRSWTSFLRRAAANSSFQNTFLVR